MKRAVLLLSLLAVLAIASYSKAQQPHLEFVRALKNQYGPRLADEYLKRLQQTAPNEFTPQLAMESATIKMEMAEKASSAAERVRLTAEARAMIDKYPGPEARLTSIKILNVQARALVVKAIREEDPAANRRGLNQSFVVLQEVEGLLRGTLKQLNADIAKVDPKNARGKKALEDVLSQAELDLGINLYDQAIAGNPGNDIDVTLKRNADLLKAQKEFERLAGKPGFAQAITASAWAGRCFQEAGEPKKAMAIYTVIEKFNQPQAEAGKRLAEYFRLLRVLRMLDKFDTPDQNENPVKEATQLGENWLKTHSRFASPAEVAGVQYILGRALYEEAANLPISQGFQKKAQYLKAREMFRKVELTDNEYSGKARSYKLQCFIFAQGWSRDTGSDWEKIKEAVARSDMQKLTSFDDLYDRAQFEMLRLREKLGEIPPDKPDSAKLAAQVRQVQMARVIEALKLTVAVGEKQDPKAPVPEDSVNQARLLLVYSYATINDTENTVKFGEQLTSKAGSQQAADASLYVLQAYMSRLKDAKSDDEKAKRRNECYKFIDDIIKRWPNEQAAHVARHQKGVMLSSENRNPEAMEVLGQVRPSYPSYVQVRYRLALMALKSSTIETDKPTATDPDKRPWRDRAVAAVLSLPPLPPGADPIVTEQYFKAKLLLTGIFYKDGKFKEMEAVFRPLYDSIENGKLLFPSPELKKELQAGVLKSVLLAGYGQADKFIQDGLKANKTAPIKYWETRKFFDSALPLVLKPSAVDLLLPGNDPNEVRFRNGYMELILKAYLFDAKGPQAAQLVQAMQKFYTATEDGGAADIVDPLINQVTAYLAELKAQAELAKKPEAAKKNKDDADKLTAALSVFADATAKSESIKALNPEYRRLLGKAYLALNKPKQAAELLKDKPAPPPATATAYAKQAYVERRVLYIRALREDKDLAGAKAEYALYTKDPLFEKDIRYQMEEAHLLDADRNFKVAARKWGAVAQQLKEKVYADKRSKEWYFECYCHWINSAYQAASTTLTEPKKTETIRKGANLIVRLEESFPDLGGAVCKVRFLKLLENEPPLKEQYDDVKKQAP